MKNRYRKAHVEKIRKSEKKNEHKLPKSKVFIRKKSSFIPEFLQFRLAKGNLHISLVYINCQVKVLEKESIAKPKTINILENDKKRFTEELPGTLSCQDFLCVFCL